MNKSSGAVPDQFSPAVRERFGAPRNYGPLSSFNGHARVTGPCGDTMEFWLQVQGGRIAHVGFTTTGCGSSKAAGSMATELADGKPLEVAARIEPADVLGSLGGLPESSEHCALLATNTLRAAIQDYRDRTADSEEDDPHAESTAHSGPERPAKASPEEQRRQASLTRKMGHVGHKLLIMSGKGGVGKSTVAANLAVALSLSGKSVGSLDVDIHGPSIPRLMGLEGHRVLMQDSELMPCQAGERLKVMSIGFLLQSPADAVIWRGPMKYGVIRQFLADVVWGRLDYLVIDAPPGTGDEPLSVAQLVGQPASAVLVTTPQTLSLADVRRSATFCRNMSLPVLGIIENMSGLICPHCGRRIDVFKTGGGEALAREVGAELLGRIPLEPKVVESGDDGLPFMQCWANNPTTAAFQAIVTRILGLLRSDGIGGDGLRKNPGG